MKEMGRIVIVEDEAVISLTIEHTLRRAGYQIAAIFTKGEDCLDYLAQQGTPDLILMDIQLEGKLDGIQTAEIIHNKYPCPVVYLTAYSGSELLERAKLSHPFGYLVKPFNAKDLCSTIEISIHRFDLERKLLVSERRFKGLANSLQQIVFQTDQDGVLTYINEIGQKVFGLMELSGGLTIQQLCFYANAGPQPGDSLDPGKFKLFFHDTIRVLCCNQRVHFFDVQISPEYNSGRLSGYYGIMIDTTKANIQVEIQRTILALSALINSKKISQDDFTYFILKLLKTLTSADSVSLQKIDYVAGTVSTIQCDFTLLQRRTGNRMPEFILANNAPVFLTGEHIEKYYTENRLGIPELLPQCWIAIPFTISDTCGGVLEMYSSASETFFNEMDFEVMKDLGRELSFIHQGAYLAELAEEREVKYKNLVDSISEGILQLDLKAEMVLFCNARLCEMFGLEGVESLIGQKLNDLYQLQPENENLRDIVERHLQGEASVHEVSIITKRGKVKWFRVSGKGFRGNTGNYDTALSVWTDITDKKKGEQLLMQSEQNQRAILDSIPDSLLILDSNGLILETMFKGRIESVIGRGQLGQGNTFNRILGEDYVSTLNEFLSESTPEGRGKKVEYRSAADGTTAWLEFRLSHIHDSRVLVLIRDITIEKGQELDLLRFYNIIEQSEELILVTDSIGRIGYVNPRFTETTGYGMDELRGSTPSILNSGKHSKEFFQCMWRTILSGKPYHGEFVNRKKSGEIFYEEKIISPVFDERGKLINFISTGRDVTEKKNTEQRLEAYRKLQEYQSKKQQRQKSLLLVQGQEEERKRLSRDLHDGIGQILTAIKINIESAEHLSGMRKKSWEKLSSAHELITEAIQEVRRVSSDLSPSGLHDFGLHAAVNSLVVRLRNTLENCKIVYRSEITDMRFKPNVEIGIYRIVQEALNNAVRHSNATEITIDISYADGMLLVSVLDNGIGIDKDKVSGSAYSEPKGKGLNNMKERANLIGGDLQIVTNPEAGVLIRCEVKSNKQDK